LCPSGRGGRSKPATTNKPADDEEEEEEEEAEAPKGKVQAEIGTTESAKDVTAAGSAEQGNAGWAPAYRGLKTSAQLEFDFFGIPPTDARKHDVALFSPIRMRHAYFKLETSATSPP
jgi:hypothetical protein